MTLGEKQNAILIFCSTRPSCFCSECPIKEPCDAYGTAVPSIDGCSWNEELCDKALAIINKEEPMETVKNDPVNPNHYKSKNGIECIQALTAATEGLEGIEAVCTANAIKYLWRWKEKNGVEDLKKAIWYINHLISVKEEMTCE